MTTDIAHQPEVLPALMEPDEAREKITRIRMSAGELRALLVEFEERRGWQVLGYASMASCCEAEFGWRKSSFYRQLEAAETERRLGVPIGENPESHLRPLAGLPADVQREAFDEAGKDGQRTAEKVERAVRKRRKATDTLEGLEPDQETPDTGGEDWIVGEIDRVFFVKRGMSLADVLRVARRVVETAEDEEAGNNRRMAARSYLKKEV